MNCDEGAFQTSKLCSFSHFRWSNTQAGEACEARKNAKSGKFPRLLSYLFIYSKSDTTQLRGGSLRTFVLNCKFDFTFHVKHCESKLKIVYIIPVRIKKRKVKKGGNIPLSATHDFIPIFFIFFISKFSLYMIFRFLQFSCTK